MEVAIKLKSDLVALDLLYKLLRNEHRETNLAAHHLHPCKLVFQLPSIKRLNILVCNEVVVISKLQDNEVEVDTHLLIRVCEVDEQREVCIKEVAHVEVRSVERGIGDLKVWVSRSVDEVDYED